MAEQQSQTPTKEHAARTGGSTAGDAQRTQQRQQRSGGNGKGKRDKRQPRREERREFDQKILSIRRVNRVVAGGRRMSFSVAIVIGDRKGRVGVGLGKAGDTAYAIEKAANEARRNMIHIPMTENSSIPHEVYAKHTASYIHMLPAPGKGIVAGSSVRNVLELGGVTDVTAKIQSRSKNRLNNAKATVEALKALEAKS
jgi:small subunit ribosomal protein S5